MKIAIIVIFVLVVAVIAFIIIARRGLARMQHYRFAHHVLPTQLFADPASVAIRQSRRGGHRRADRCALLRPPYEREPNNSIERTHRMLDTHTSHRPLLGWMVSCFGIPVAHL